MIYYAPDIPVKEIAALPDAPKPRGNPGRQGKPKYKAVVCAFDIETTALKKIHQSVMYIWQLQIGFEITIIGRTWIEFLDCTERIKDALGDKRLVTYVHNLSYEFQFLSGIWYFSPEDVFCTEPRSILRADMGPYELRCSYRLSNMSLDEYTRQMKAEHRKLSGIKFDYSKKRYPWTKLSPDELAYCINDVLGLVESVTQQMINEGDTLYSCPMTATGFPRRDERKAMRTFNWNTMRRLLPPFDVYLHLRRAFRGGNTHANRHFTGQIVYDVTGMDMASAYPAAMLLRFPMGRWYEANPSDYNLEYLRDLIVRRKKAVLMRVAFLGIRLKDPRWPVPYLAYDKCDHVISYTVDEMTSRGWKKFSMSLDNGRIMAASYLETTITDIDLSIIVEEYDWDKMDIQYLAFSTYGPLPSQIRETMLQYYDRKTSLKGIPQEAFLYDASKRKINALYGMMVQDAIQVRYLYKEGGEMDASGELVPYVIDKSKTDEELYEKTLKYAYQSYAWGVWITAYCRRRLEDGIRLIFETGEREKKETGRIKTHFVYADTDSLKFTGNADFTELNNHIEEQSRKMNGTAKDRKGKEHVLGCYEWEYCTPMFLTWGAKKYVYMDPDAYQRQTVAGTGDTWHITIAGVNKIEGAKELERAGGIEALLPDETCRPAFVFRESGGVEAVYNDYPDIGTIKIGGHELEITRNVYLEQHPYTLSVTAEYERIIMHPDLWRDLLDSGPDV